MAQPGETPSNPTPPAPPPAEDSARSATAKRPREDSDAAWGEEACGGAPSAKRRVKSAMDIIFRIVVPSRQIGKVIGKEGTRIQKVREETKATIKIADAIARHEERVIIISSKDSDNAISDAENALLQIAHLILKDDGDNLEALKAGAVHVAPNTIRLLIAGSQAGGLIGISGQNIEKLRISSGATLTVLAPSQLPYASAHESDRVVQISGDVSAVMKALQEIGTQLRDNPPGQVIALNPTYNHGFNRPRQQTVDPTSADYVAVEMMVSESMVGGLIGRCGSNISRIRIESGATIKVHGGKGEQKHRQIHIAGNTQQVALAKQRIDEYIHSQLIQQAGIQLSVDPTGGMMTAFTPFFATTATNQAFFTPAATNQAFFTSTATSQAPAYPGLSFHAPPL